MSVLAHATAEPNAWWGVTLTAAGIAALAGAYLAGLWVLGSHDQASAPRLALARGIDRHGRLRVLSFVVALAAVVVALLSPLEKAAETYFSAHMVQHMLLIAVAAPLLAVGAPGLPLMLAAPPRLRRWLGGHQYRLRTSWPVRVLALPVTAWFLHIGVLWAWHMPAAFDAALHSELLHVVEHLSFVGTSWLLWWHVATPGRARMRRPVAAMYLFTVLLPSAALGAVLTLAATPLYAEQAARTVHAGADALADQQLAGLVMWIPADVVYLVAIVGLVFAWLAGWRASVSHRDHVPLPQRSSAAVLPPEEVPR